LLIAASRARESSTGLTVTPAAFSSRQERTGDAQPATAAAHAVERAFYNAIV
jgi:hypothetical protein